MKYILCLIFFLSGAAALIFESLWFQLTGLALGNSVIASAVVLASFMGGLALGNGLAGKYGAAIRFPLRFYAFLELTIGAAGFLLIIALPELTEFFAPFFMSISDKPLLLNVIRCGIAFILMLFPSSAMGMTLPVLVKALYAENKRFGQILGLLYGWNTLGAAAGVLFSELVLVKALGLTKTGFTASCFCLLAAVIAFMLNRRFSSRAGDIQQDSDDVSEIGKDISCCKKMTRRSSLMLAASFLSGFVFLALEVLWFRFMMLFYDAYSLYFAVMLAVVLVGISIGGLAASRWFKYSPEAHNYLSPIFFVNCVLVIFLYERFRSVITILLSYLYSQGFNSNTIYIFSSSIFFMLPVAVCSGITFTMLGKALHNELKQESRAAGLLSLANTFGAMLGSLFSALALIPFVGLENSFFVLALTYAFAGLICFDFKKLKQSGHVTAVLCVSICVLSAAVCFFPFGRMEKIMDLPCMEYFKRGEKRVAVREGVTETIQYLQKNIGKTPYYHRLVTNNHSMSATDMRARRYMKMYVYWAVAVNPDCKKALLICYGCGSTAKAMTDTKTLEKIDIVDISRDVIEMSEVVFPDSKQNPVNDPRVNIHIDDGRFFLNTAMQKYDLITAEPPPPGFSGVVNLYSQEYFELIKRRLTPGGIVTYWLPVFQMKQSDSKAVLKAFKNTFPETTLWIGSGLDWMMVGVKDGKGPATVEQFSRQWNDKMTGAELKALGFETPEQFGSLFLAGGKRLTDWLGDTQPLVDDYPQRLSYVQHNLDRDKYIAFMNASESKKSFEESALINKLWPEELIKRTLPYFPVRNLINDHFDNMSPVLPRLHMYMHHPLLQNYVIWSFKSDEFAQRIIAKEISRDEFYAPGKTEYSDMSYYLHLAARAAREKNLMLAEKYLSLADEKIPAEASLSKSVNFSFRIYLLFLMNKQKEADLLSRQYINLLPDGKDIREKEVRALWSWLRSILRAGRNKPQH
ncbi:MAG: fused MFS/spermidine synthase [Planctomycetota bacterium]|jgi:spermidine synthase